MKIRLTLFFLISCTNVYKTFAQTITLQISDVNYKPIQFVNCFDSVKGTLQCSNSSGKILLDADNYDLKLSHVSYKQYPLHLKKFTRDTTIKITLEIRNELSTEVVVTTEKKTKSKKRYEAGHFHENSQSTLVFQTKANIGILIDNYKKNTDYKLESINFKLNNARENRKENFIIEIKLYEVTDGVINEEPINNKPIYVYSTEFKEKNTISIKENIFLPKEALFLLFSIPLLDKTTKSTVTFPMLVNAKKCELFGVSDKDLTVSQTSLSKMNCRYDNFFQAYKAIPVGISYYK